MNVILCAPSVGFVPRAKRTAEKAGPELRTFAFGRAMGRVIQNK